jgi:transposase
MEKLRRRRYTLEYKQEAVRLVSSGQKVAAAAKALGIVEQTLANWVEAEKAGQLRGGFGGHDTYSWQIKLSRLIDFAIRLATGSASCDRAA